MMSVDALMSGQETYVDEVDECISNIAVVCEVCINVSARWQ